MRDKYTLNDLELMKLLLNLQEMTAPIRMSIGCVVNGMVKEGIIIHEAPPKVIEVLIQEGYSCNLTDAGLRVCKL